MKRRRWQTLGLVVAVAAAVLAGGCKSAQDRGGGKAAGDSKSLKVREAAVAGTFYPADKDPLTKDLDRYLGDVPAFEVGRVRGIVVPHAGYAFSGPVAAYAYKALAGQPIRTVILLGPSHYARFEGASVGVYDVFRTPLGDVKVSPLAAQLAGGLPFVPAAPCEVERPEGWRQAPMEIPPFGQDTSHTWEHSLEVQLPFLQKVLGGFELVPVVFGTVAPQGVADALADRLDDTTLVVASSDLSHYYPYAKAVEKDAACIKAIRDLDTDAMATQEACGRGPILTLMDLAKKKGWKPRLLDYRNSGDTTGDKDRVVGYAAFAFCETGTAGSGTGGTAEAAGSGRAGSGRAGAAGANNKTAVPGPGDKPASAPAPAAGGAGTGPGAGMAPGASAATPAAGAAAAPAGVQDAKSQAPKSQDKQAEAKAEITAGPFTADEQKALLTLARQTIRAAVGDGKLPAPDPAVLPGRFKERKGCFVTLTKQGRLRGCIGYIFPQGALYEAVIDNARNAAVRDPRFDAVQAAELDQLQIEISVLSEPKAMAYSSPEDLLAKLTPRQDGVVLQIGTRQATYLPQVWEQIPEKEKFMEELSVKAGLPSWVWKMKDAKILIYRVEAFKE